MDKINWYKQTVKQDRIGHTVRLYERDETGKFWPAGKYTFETSERALASLSFYATNETSEECGAICGIVTTPDYIAAYRGMTLEEALRVSPVKIVANTLLDCTI